MHLFILDFGGTLDQQPNPAGFVAALKARHLGAQVVLCTGSDTHEITQDHPALFGVLDAVWEKPCMLSEKLKDYTFDHVTLVDNDAGVRNLARRMMRAWPASRVLDAPDLINLLLE